MNNLSNASTCDACTGARVDGEPTLRSTLRQAAEDYVFRAHDGEDGVKAEGFLLGPNGAPMRRRNGLPDIPLGRLKRASVLEAVVAPNLGPPNPPLLIWSPVLPGASP